MKYNQGKRGQRDADHPPAASRRSASAATVLPLRGKGSDWAITRQK